MLALYVASASSQKIRDITKLNQKRHERSQYTDPSSFLDPHRTPLCSRNAAMGEPAERQTLFAKPAPQGIYPDLSQPVSGTT